MSNYSEYFLNSKSSVISFETLEISHPNFTRTYRVVRNATLGLTATLETSEVVTFEYYPLRIENAGVKDDLDQAIKVVLGDLGDIIPNELDAVLSNDAFDIKPTVKYRLYRSDDLTQPLYGPIRLEITTFSFNREGCSFEATAPYLNISKTGEVYSIARFPMLRGFL